MKPYFDGGIVIGGITAGGEESMWFRKACYNYVGCAALGQEEGTGNGDKSR